MQTISQKTSLFPYVHDVHVLYYSYRLIKQTGKNIMKYFAETGEGQYKNGPYSSVFEAYEDITDGDSVVIDPHYEIDSPHEIMDENGKVIFYVIQNLDELKKGENWDVNSNTCLYVYTDEDLKELEREFEVEDQRHQGDLVSSNIKKRLSKTEKMHISIDSDIAKLLDSQQATKTVAINALLRYAIDSLVENKERLVL